MITSVQNNQVKNWRKLQTKKYRTQSQRFLIEGFHLIEEAIKSDWEIETIIIQNGIDIPDWISKDLTIHVNTHVFNEISQTETTQGIAAVVKMKELYPKHDGIVLLVDAIQDPGNLGTIIRTADAAGLTKIFLGKGTVDPYNDKVIRASQGSIFHIPITQGNLLELIPELQAKHYMIVASTLENATNYMDIKPREKMGLIIGNEGAGINKDIVAIADKTVTIPIYGQAESLNVSVAAGILMYQMRK